MGVRFTIKELERLKAGGLIQDYKFNTVEVIANAKKPKFGNVKTEIDGIVFDSDREAKRYVQLRFHAKAGLIKDLLLQVSFELNEGGTHHLRYIADFVYTDIKSGEHIVEDAKGFRTKEYKKKKKLMKKIYSIDIREV
jgi:hypothetical protein